MRPEYVYNGNNSFWSSVKIKLSISDKVIFFLDYDGTLTPIQPSPGQAQLPVKAKKLLQDLAEKQNIAVVIVTGRSYNDIYSMIGLSNVVYISNHGFEIIENNERWVYPLIEPLSEKFRDIYKKLQISLSDTTGIIVEDKGLTISIHYRNVNNKDIPMVSKEISSIISKYDGGIKLTEGKKVYEIRPDIAWDKGKATLDWLQKKQLLIESTPLIIAIGDDKTDEDMFRALKDISITIKVGNDNPTRAEYFLNDPEEVYNLLLKLDKMFPLIRHKD